MQGALLDKLDNIANRHQELEGLLAQADVIANQDRFRRYAQEYARLEGVVSTYLAYKKTYADIQGAKAMRADPEMRVLANDEIKTAELVLKDLGHRLQLLLLPKDPHDGSNVFLEIRAGAGGDEAAIFAADLFKMYCRYAETQSWVVETLHENHAEQGGYKEMIARIVGTDIYSKLKFESGAHRVQRVPETESQGRIHTSTCTVAILPELSAIEKMDISPSDLRIDTFRASGAGGQHVNKTDSAIRITYLPTGLVVECQDERSQHKNKARALSLLQAKLQVAEQEKQDRQQAQTRRHLIGRGDRSERIRTYNFPQGRMTDHRIGLTLYSLDEIITGDLGQVIGPLINAYQADQLASLALK